jgi:hypothetical protein
MITAAMLPGYAFPSKTYRKDAPNQGSSTPRVADKITAPIVFYPPWLISVEETGRFAPEAAQGKWEGKGEPISQNAEMENLVKGFNRSHVELSCKLLSSFYRGHVSHV